MPKSLYRFCECLQKILFCCFPRPKEDKKNDVILETGEFRKFEDNEITNETNNRKMKCNGCQNIFTSCRRKQIAAESNDMNSIPTTPTMLNRLKQKRTSSKNVISAIDASHVKLTLIKIKKKEKTKKDIESKCSALNYFIFFIVFVFMFISELAVWLSMSS